MRLAKYNVYIGCIIDESHWSATFSLVVIMPDLELRDLGSRHGSGTLLEVFIYRSISPPTTFGAWCQDDYRYCWSSRAKISLQSQKEPGI